MGDVRGRDAPQESKKAEKMSRLTSDIISTVRNLREKQTPAERLMQAKLRFAGITAVFQYPVIFSGGYIIADFYLPRFGVILEIDGGYHQTEEQIKKDLAKDNAYKSHGYNVVRIKNTEVDTFHTKSLTTFRKTKELKTRNPDKVTQKKKRIRKEHKINKNRGL